MKIKPFLPLLVFSLINYRPSCWFGQPRSTPTKAKKILLIHIKDNLTQKRR